MNGNISIEDILQRHTVHELRALISQLERESSGKQTELQLMVSGVYSAIQQTLQLLDDESLLFLLTVYLLLFVILIIPPHLILYQ